MNTRIIGIKDFRNNISDYVQKAQQGKERFIITNRNKPLFELKPFAETSNINSIFESIIKAQQDIKKGLLYSHADILKELE